MLQLRSLKRCRIKTDLKFLITLCFLFISVAAEAEVIVADLNAAGENKGMMVFERSGNKYISKEEIVMGECRSKVLNDFGAVRHVSNATGDVIYLSPRNECLDRKVIDYRSAKPLRLTDSKSLFLNYTVSDVLSQGGDTLNYGFGTGLFLFDSIFYSDFYKGTERLIRGNSYFSHDIIKEKLNITAGDTYISSSSVFLKSSPVAGMSIRRNYSVDPAFTPYSGLSQTLTLTTKSIVEIYRDGILMDRREMAAGIYDIRNLPVSSFAGNLKIKIRDIYNNEQIIDIPYFVSQTNLKAGVDDFYFTAGVKRHKDDFYSGLTGGGYYRRGISDNITLGIAASDRVSVSGVFSTLYGIFNAEKVASFNMDDYRLGYSYSNSKFSAGADLTTKDRKGDFTTQIGFPLSSLSRDFGSKWGSINLRYYSNGDTKYGLGWTFNPIARTTILADAGYSKQDKGSYTLTAIQSISKNLTGSLSVSHDKLRGNTVYASLQMALTKDKKTSYGFDAKTTVDRHKTTVDAEVKGRDGMLANLRNTYDSQTHRTSTTAGLSGSYACVMEGNEWACGIGEPISPAAGFVAGQNLAVNSDRGDVLTVAPYLTQSITQEGFLTSHSKDISLRAGQGAMMNMSYMKAVTGRLFKDGYPLALTEIKVEGQDVEYMTSTKGDFYIENIPAKAKQVRIYAGEKEVMITLNDNDAEVERVGVIAVQ